MLLLIVIYFFIFSAKEKDRKESLDPLNEMKKYLEIKKSHKEDKRKKHEIAGKDSSRQKQSIKEMRRERLRREQEEREKERRLLANIGKEKHSAAIKRPNYDAPQRYQFLYPKTIKVINFETSNSSPLVTCISGHY